MLRKMKLCLVAIFASSLVAACGGGGEDAPAGAPPTLTQDAPGGISGMGSAGGDVRGGTFQMPSGIQSPNNWAGLYVGPSGDSIPFNPVALSGERSKDLHLRLDQAIASTSNESKSLVIHLGDPVDKIVGSGWAVTVRIPLENKTSAPIDVTFPAGYVVKANDNTAFQHGVLLKKVTVTVPANTTVTVGLTTYCANELLGGSYPTATYSWGVISSSATLNALIELLKNKKINYEDFGANYTGYWETVTRLQTIVHNLTDKGIALGDDDRAWINALPNAI